MTEAQQTVGADRSQRTRIREVELGAFGPGARSAAGLSVRLRGDRIVDVGVRLGRSHRGFEKECETRGWAEAVPFADRLGDTAAGSASLALCLGIERLAGIRVPERAEWLRVLVAELTRVVDHLTRLSRIALGLDAKLAYAKALGGRESALDLLEALTGARVTLHYIRVGGVAADLPKGFEALARNRLAAIRADVAAFDALVSRNRFFVDRLRGVAPLAREDALGFAVTGPLARASGLGIDTRKDAPYLAYDRIDFDVPLGEVGDNTDRALVCVEEIAQSLAIVDQCHGQLERASRTSVRTPCDLDAVPPGEVYSAVESPNGELGFYLVSDGGARPVRVHCRAPSLAHLAVLPTLLAGAREADIGPTVDCVNAVGAEAER